MKIVFLQLMNVVFRWVSEGKINADPRQARLVQELQDLTERCQGYNPGLWGLKKHKSEKLERKQKSEVFNQLLLQLSTQITEIS